MDEFDSYISVDSFTKAKDSNYVAKYLVIGKNNKVETPLKIFNVSNLSKNDLSIWGNYIKDGVIETTKYVSQLRSYNSLYSMLEVPSGNQKSKLNQFFKINDSFKKFNSVISLSFSKNPFVANKFDKGSSKQLSYDNFEFLLDYLYEFSTYFVLVPDIDFKSFTDFNDYLFYVKRAVDSISYLNNKPIFVPVSMKLDHNSISNLLDYYHKNNFSNLWFNFNSAQLNTKISSIKFVLRLINRYFGDSAIVYFSNMKKEINKNINDIFTKPSDALAPFAGCDFLGANRESGFPSKKISDMGEITYQRKTSLNKNRIFDPNSYYYFNVDSYPNNLILSKETILNHNGYSDMLNSKILNMEFKKSKDFVEENKKIGKYLSNKTIFSKEKNLKDDLIFFDENQSDLFSYFENL